MRRSEAQRTQKLPYVPDCGRAEIAIAVGSFVKSRPDLRRHEARMALEPTMLRLKRQQRAILADKLPDAANLALGALVFGQFLSPGYSTTLGVVGLLLWIAFMALAVRIAGGTK